MTQEDGQDGEARPTVAAFDFDGTITRGGSTIPFLIRARGLLPVLYATARTLPRIIKAAIFAGTSADEAKEQLFTLLLADQPLERIERLGAAFAEQQLSRRLRPEVRARLDWHRRQGHRVVVVSASPECYVEAAAGELGVDGVVATRLEVDRNGKLTGHFAGGNCRGERKRDRLLQWMVSSSDRRRGGEGTFVGALPEVQDKGRPYLWAYGNSAGDLQMLEEADIGVDAGRLGRFGKLRRFRRLGDVLTAW